MSSFETKVQTVSEITRSLKGLIESGFAFVAVSGEISNLRRPYSGHFYFTLKDNAAQLKAVLFKGQQRYLAAPLRDGDEVVCRGRLSIYEPRGEYQIIVDTVTPRGDGALLAAFTELKRRLAAEGLFDEDHKRPLPAYPQRLAVVTSPQGAAVRDFLTTGARRFPGVEIDVYAAAVQGDHAAAEIRRALARIVEDGEYDAVVICRGGGSMEDLRAFNDEALARAVHVCPLPVVSAVGHETDFTILDFVADHRAATPTAAAEILFPDGCGLRLRVNDWGERLCGALARRLEGLRATLDLQRRLLGTPQGLIESMARRLEQQRDRFLHTTNAVLAGHRQRLERVTARMQAASPAQAVARNRERLAAQAEHLRLLIGVDLSRHREHLKRQAAILAAVNPRAVLDRGYAIVTTPDGRVVRAPGDTAPGDQLLVRLHKGTIVCEVRSLKLEA